MNIRDTTLTAIGLLRYELEGPRFNVSFGTYVHDYSRRFGFHLGLMWATTAAMSCLAFDLVWYWVPLWAVLGYSLGTCVMMVLRSHAYDGINWEREQLEGVPPVERDERPRTVPVNQGQREVELGGKRVGRFRFSDTEMKRWAELNTFNRDYVVGSFRAVLTTTDYKDLARDMRAHDPPLWADYRGGFVWTPAGDEWRKS